MTCGLALKRPHDYEAYLSPDNSIEAKRSRGSAYCSPFRPQLGTLAASLPMNNALNLLKDNETKDNSIFAGIERSCRLTDQQISRFLNTEITALNKRKRLIAKRKDKNVEDSSCETPNNSSVKAVSAYTRFREAGSPSSGSDSDSDSLLIGGKRKCNRRGDSLNEQLYTYEEMFSIINRLLKQQEINLRSEYEVTIRKKLEEQHEQYCQFAEEQFQRNNKNDHSYSYFS
uniref:Akirin (inferred by orthology to a D. melanogaster protein) n=1 Tax=Strongyloides venezuelensis TaxID=75913 RepID=A0A0K0G170_STRVS